MAAAKVRLLLKGELVQEVPFDRPALRIGRMKENDLVVNNLSVSRFHATLNQADGAFVIEDLGSADTALPEALRASLISIGMFALRQGEALRLGQSDDFESVIDDNKMIRDSLA